MTDLSKVYTIKREALYDNLMEYLDRWDELPEDKRVSSHDVADELKKMGFLDGNTIVIPKGTSFIEKEAPVKLSNDSVFLVPLDSELNIGFIVPKGAIQNEFQVF